MRWIKRRRLAIEARLGPLRIGIVQGIGGVAGPAALLAVAAVGAGLADPSEQLFRDLATAEVGLFVAYSVAVAGVGLRGDKKLTDHLNWLGYGCGIGISGLIGIVLSIALAAYREAGHAGVLDILGLCWIAASIVMLGLVVALLPYATFVWKQPSEASSATGGDAK